MQSEITTEKIPIRLWLDQAEPGALEQARNLANLPFAFSHIALMPDCHQGFGMPIGGVLATRDVIVPNAVGVDIGCGMGAVQTSLQGISHRELKSIMSEIRDRIPLGFKHHAKACDESHMPARMIADDKMPVVFREYQRARHQLGTLGGGNHFIEIQHGSDHQIWIMLHSGSRNLGKQVADHYNRLAIQKNQEWNSEVPRSWQLAWLPADSPEGLQYEREMQYCIDFAFANRQKMMDQITGVFQKHFGPAFSHAPLINIAHNFAARESHQGRQLIVHRKGATRASLGLSGIIPGSQGSASYIVRGKGNPASFESCSHGAGRVMGRKEAIRSLDLEKEKARLDKQGILHSIRSKNDLEEAMGAYKDIAVVMRQQADLVDVLLELKPLAVIKG